jgi:hypothetical protein
MFSFPISPVSEDTVLNEQRGFPLKNVGSDIKKLQKQLKDYALYPINASVSAIKKAIRTRKFDHNVHEKGFESLMA